MLTGDRSTRVTRPRGVITWSLIIQRRDRSSRDAGNPTGGGPMNDPELHHTAAKLAHMLAFHCVRNSSLEELHAGVFPSSKTGDYTDVKVVTASDGGLNCGDVA